MISYFANLTSTSAFWDRRIFLVKLNWWFKFYVNIVTIAGVMTIFVYQEFDRKSGKWKYPYLI